MAALYLDCLIAPEQRERTIPLVTGQTEYSDGVTVGNSSTRLAYFVKVIAERDSGITVQRDSAFFHLKQSKTKKVRWTIPTVGHVKGDEIRIAIDYSLDERQEKSNVKQPREYWTTKKELSRFTLFVSYTFIEAAETNESTGKNQEKVTGKEGKEKKWCDESAKPKPKGRGGENKGSIPATAGTTAHQEGGQKDNDQKMKTVKCLLCQKDIEQGNLQNHCRTHADITLPMMGREFVCSSGTTYTNENLYISHLKKCDLNHSTARRDACCESITVSIQDELYSRADTLEATIWKEMIRGYTGMIKCLQIKIKSAFMSHEHIKCSIDVTGSTTFDQTARKNLLDAIALLLGVDKTQILYHFTAVPGFDLDSSESDISSGGGDTDLEEEREERLLAGMEESSVTSEKEPKDILVLVTGASGYVATHIVHNLLKRGFRVRGTVRSLKNAAKQLPQNSSSGRETYEQIDSDDNTPQTFSMDLYIAHAS